MRKDPETTLTRVPGGRVSVRVVPDGPDGRRDAEWRHDHDSARSPTGT